MTLLSDGWLQPPIERGDGRYLVIVTSDVCQFSQAQLTKWVVLMKTLPFAPQDQVLVISTSGDEIARALAATAAEIGVHFSAHHVRQLAGFGQETGIAWTPETLALDSQFRIRLSSENVTAVFREELGKWFAHLPTN
jgi:hypothetical protein